MQREKDTPGLPISELSVDGTVSVSLSTCFSSSAFFKLPRWIFDLFVFYSLEGKLPAEEGEAQRGVTCPRSRGALLARAVLGRTWHGVVAQPTSLLSYSV